MRSPFVIITLEVNKKKRIKTKIGVGCVVKEMAEEMEENTREGRIRRESK